MDKNTAMAALATAGAILTAGMAQAGLELSLLDRPGWLRTGDKEKSVWSDGADGKTLTIHQEKGANE